MVYFDVNFAIFMAKDQWKSLINKKYIGTSQGQKESTELSACFVLCALSCTVPHTRG